MRLFRILYGGTGCILLLHRVVHCSDVDQARMPAQRRFAISPLHLEQLIEWCNRRQFEFISLDEMESRLSAGVSSDRKWMVVTLDDGYVDNYDVAFPIFKHFKIPFAIYVATSFPDHTAVLWWHYLEQLVLNADSVTMRLNGVDEVLDCPTFEGKMTAITRMSAAYLEQVKSSDQRTAFLKMFSISDEQVAEHTASLALSWNQIRELSNHPLCTIGAHTVTHRKLKPLSQRQCREEIVDSCGRIEQETGIRPQHFAYPHGTRDAAGPREFAIASDVGLRTATTTRCGNIFPAHKEHLRALPRLEILSDYMVRDPHWVAVAVDGVIPALRHRFRRVITD